MSNETPKESLAAALHSIDHPNFSFREINALWAATILAYLKEEGGWELVKIIPKSMPFTGIYPPGTK